MVEESTMKNKFELREEREVDIAKAFIGVSLIRNQADERSCHLNNSPQPQKTLTRRLDINIVNI